MFCRTKGPNHHGFVMIIVVVAALGMGSCATTHESVLGEGYETICIPVFENDTMHSGMEEAITASVIHAFIRDRRMRVTGRSHADAILQATIADVEIDPVNFTDLDRAVGYNMTMVVNAQLFDRPTGRALTPQSTFRVSGPFLLSNEPSPERQRDIGTDLAESMISRFLDGW